jgi:hypothetical protein
MAVDVMGFISSPTSLAVVSATDLATNRKTPSASTAPADIRDEACDS